MTGKSQTLPWWLEGEKVKTTENNALDYAVRIRTLFLGIWEP
jgi:hypothetical protein